MIRKIPFFFIIVVYSCFGMDEASKPLGTSVVMSVYGYMKNLNKVPTMRDVSRLLPKNFGGGDRLSNLLKNVHEYSFDAAKNACKGSVVYKEAKKAALYSAQLLCKQMATGQDKSLVQTCFQFGSYSSITLGGIAFYGVFGRFFKKRLGKTGSHIFIASLSGAVAIGNLYLMRKLLGGNSGGK